MLTSSTGQERLRIAADRIPVRHFLCRLVEYGYGMRCSMTRNAGQRHYGVHLVPDLFDRRFAVTGRFSPTLQQCT